MEDRIRVSNADEPAGRRRSQSHSVFSIVAIVAALAVTFGLVTSRPATDEAQSAEGLDQPNLPAGFRTVAHLEAGPWDALRVDGAYLFDTPAGVTVITDDDRVFEVDLPELDTLFGAIIGPEGSLAFGLTVSGPALWHSADNAEWTVEPLPWNGTVRAAATDGERLRLIGIERADPAFTYISAERSDPGDDWTIERLDTAPDAGLMSVPGGFVGRGRATDGGGFGYVYSSDGREWSYLSDRSSGSRLPLIWPKATGNRIGLIPVYDSPEAGDGELSIAADARTIVPPDEPISGVWLEGETVWLQTPSAAWSSTNGVDWDMFALDRSHGVDAGFVALLPVGDEARIAALSERGIALMRWDPGSD